MGMFNKILSINGNIKYSRWSTEIDNIMQNQVPFSGSWWQSNESHFSLFITHFTNSVFWGNNQLGASFSVDINTPNRKILIGTTITLEMVVRYIK